MSTITIEVSDDFLSRFEKPAALLGISPEELARRSAAEFFSQDDSEFGKILDYLLKKNEDLLNRLAR